MNERKNLFESLVGGFSRTPQEVCCLCCLWQTLLALFRLKTPAVVYLGFRVSQCSPHRGVHHGRRVRQRSLRGLNPVNTT